MATAEKKAFGKLWTTTLITVAVVLMAVGLWRLLRPNQLSWTKLTITGGSASGLRHSIAETLSDIASQNGVNLTVTATNGSVDAMQQVENGSLNFALIQGGLGHSDFSQVKQAAVLHVEPLHVLIKAKTNKILDHWNIETVGQLLEDNKPIKINLSKKGSGTNLIARDLLRFFDIQENVDYQPIENGYDYLISPERVTDEMPDVAFTVSSLPSPVAKHLIHEHGYRPLEMSVANAYRLDWTAQDEDQANGVIRRKIVAAKIPAYTYQVNPPVPRAAVDTIGTRLQLVASSKTPPAAVEQLLEIVYESSFASTSDPPLSLELLQSASEFDLHAGAAGYLERKTPVITEKTGRSD